VRNALSLLHLQGGYLYQHRPDVIPEGYLTGVEIALWARFFEDKKRR
jgi:hypothetical protein